MTKLPRGKIDFQSLYKWAGVLHMDIGRMSLWELNAAITGYGEANGGRKRGGSISEDRLTKMGIQGFG